ncbi:MAG TPA: nucleoside monophosphate kinase [Candidatus Sulfotelmatobacter sp.]|nr:nucleoside monophosphate kinase [Candidatus Sulfotelmatobacter sp.]
MRRIVIWITAMVMLGAYIAGMAKLVKADRVAWLQGPSGHCEEVPQGNSAPWRVVLLGAPGVGKGTQAALLAEQMGACHLSTGDVFRHADGRPECEQSVAMQEAMEFMRRGELVPDATVWEMVRERKACLHCRGGFILDGFPRTLAQAESLQTLLVREGLALTAVVNYEMPEAEIVARLGGRRTCEACKAVYHVTERPAKVDGQCDKCGGKLVLREDDRPEAIKVRLEAYERSTAPLISYYQKMGLLLRVPATGSAEEICVRTIVDLKGRRLKGFAEKLWAAAENRRDT